MDYKLIRTNRKTVAIQLQKDGSVIVRAPKRLAVYRIEAFIKEKQNWIEQHQKRLQEQQRQKESFCLSDGQFPLFGRMLPMQMTQEKAPCWQQTVVLHQSWVYSPLPCASMEQRAGGVPARVKIGSTSAGD